MSGARLQIVEAVRLEQIDRPAPQRLIADHAETEQQCSEECVPTRRHRMDSVHSLTWACAPAKTMSCMLPAHP
ncbi:hypothetical protein PQQ88_14710 [Paraburkholderia caledonica]|jgi:hypothetical protein|uniref:hypothetical protein n=1 Tax=Paraburkholderia caledonica TaxID=134536 RepID=UPI000D93C925|nr:hypothetical protein [Paraburkholderia caledonica]